MKELFKSVFNETFEGCSELDIVKTITGVLIALFFIVVCCAADSLGPWVVAICLSICIVLGRHLGISDAIDAVNKSLKK